MRRIGVFLPAAILGVMINTAFLLAHREDPDLINKTQPLSEGEQEKEFLVNPSTQGNDCTKNFDEEMSTCQIQQDQDTYTECVLDVVSRKEECGDIEHGSRPDTPTASTQTDKKANFAKH